MSRNRISSWLPAYVIVALLWGSSFAAVEISLRSLTPMAGQFVRTALSCLTMLAISAALRTRFPAREHWGRIAILALLSVVLPGVLLMAGQTYVSSALSGIIGSLVPLMTLAIVVLFYREERPTAERIIGLVIGLVGMLVVLGAWSQLGGSTLLGVILLISSNAAFAASLPYSRRHFAGGSRAKPVDPIALATALFTFGAIELLPLTFIAGVQRGPWQWEALVAAAYLGIVVSTIGWMMNFRLVRNSDATTASTVTYFFPLVAVAVGATLLDEHITWNQIVGGAIILFGAALAQGLLHLRRREA